MAGNSDFIKFEGFLTPKSRWSKNAQMTKKVTRLN